MHKVHVHRDIAVSRERTWQILDDFGGIHRFHPLVDSSPVSNGIDSGLDAERVCHFTNGDQISERITEYDAGRSYTVEITDPGKFPLKKGVARLTVEPLTESRSRVHFEMSFEPKYGPLGWLMGKTVMRAQFGRILKDVLAGLESHARTGRIVGQSAAPALA